MKSLLALSISCLSLAVSFIDFYLYTKFWGAMLVVILFGGLSVMGFICCFLVWLFGTDSEYDLHRDTEQQPTQRKSMLD